MRWRCVGCILIICGGLPECHWERGKLCGRTLSLWRHPIWTRIYLRLPPHNKESPLQSMYDVVWRSVGGDVLNVLLWPSRTQEGNALSTPKLLLDAVAWWKESKYNMMSLVLSYDVTRRRNEEQMMLLLHLPSISFLTWTLLRNFFGVIPARKYLYFQHVVSTNIVPCWQHDVSPPPLAFWIHLQALVIQ